MENIPLPNRRVGSTLTSKCGDHDSDLQKVFFNLIEKINCVPNHNNDKHFW